MTARVHRVVVRGQFAGLTDEQRAALLAEVDDHDIFRSSFTEWGTFTYDARLVAFNLRYEVRTDTDDDPPVDPADEGLRRARATLADWGLGATHLRATAADMAAMWDGRGREG